MTFTNRKHMTPNATNQRSPKGFEGLVLEGELTIVEVEGFIGRAISALLAHPEGLAIDCRELTYVDAAALQALASLRIEAASRGIPILVENLSESILNDAQLLGMSNILANKPPQAGGS